MTNRERFHAVMNGDPAVDRCPALEWATWWDKTIAEWEDGGIPRGMDSSALYRYWRLWYGRRNIGIIQRTAKRGI